MSILSPHFTPHLALLNDGRCVYENEVLHKIYEKQKTKQINKQKWYKVKHKKKYCQPINIAKQNVQNKISMEKKTWNWFYNTNSNK